LNVDEEMMKNKKRWTKMKKLKVCVIACRKVMKIIIY